MIQYDGISPSHYSNNFIHTHLQFNYFIAYLALSYVVIFILLVVVFKVVYYLAKVSSSLIWSPHHISETHRGTSTYTTTV